MTPLRHPALVALLALAGTAPALGASLSVPLRELTDAPEMTLRCVTDQQSLSIPLPERWSVQRAVLSLRLSVSNNIIRDSSQLVIRVNDAVVSQTRLNPPAPGASLDVPIPPELLEPGYNRVTFESIQHSTMIARGQCPGPCSPDMWSSIDLKKSAIRIDYEPAAVPLDLSKLSSFVFDPRITPEAAVHIVTEDLSEAAVNAAAVVASGIARRFDYRKVSFSLSRELDPGKDNVIVGKLGYVGGFLAARKAELQPQKGGYLRVMHLPGAGGPDPRRALVVVSGETDDAVRIAAMTFSSMAFAFPANDALNVFSFALPNLEQYSGREVLSSDRLYTLKTLNFSNHTFRGFNAGARRIGFRLPADFHIRPNQYAALTLNFSYGSGLKGDSSLNVLVNGSSVRAIPLTERSGALIEGYRIDIPTYLFKPGANVLEIAPGLHVEGQVCDLLQTDNLFVTVYENSTLQFPAMPHLVEMPRLDLFMYNGFPVTRWPDGHEATVLLAERDDTVAAAAFNLLGLLTQKNGFPLFGLQLAYALPPGAGEVIVVGAVDKLPEGVRKGVPLAADGSATRVPYPVVRSWAQESSIAYSTQNGALGPGRGLLMQFQSPFQSGRTITVLTAADNANLAEVSRELLKPAVHGQARGNITLVELATPEAKVSTMHTGETYMTGKGGEAASIMGMAYAVPALHYAILLGTLALLSLVVYVLMRRRRAAKAT